MIENFYWDNTCDKPSVNSVQNKSFIVKVLTVLFSSLVYFEQSLLAMHFGLLFSLIFQLFAQWRHSVPPAPFDSFPSRGGRGWGAWSQVLLFQFHTQTLQPVVAHCGVKLGSIQRNNELYQLKVDVGMLNTVKIYWADISRIPHMFLLTYNGVKSLSLLAGCDLPLHISYVVFLIPPCLGYRDPIQNCCGRWKPFATDSSVLDEPQKSLLLRGIRYNVSTYDTYVLPPRRRRPKLVLTAGTTIPLYVKLGLQNVNGYRKWELREISDKHW